MQRKGGLKKWLLIPMIILLVMGLIHYIVFPEQTRSLLIGFSSFQKEGVVYFEPETPKSFRDSLQTLITKGQLRLTNFWGKHESDPVFIYCHNKVSFKKYGGSSMIPALTHIKSGARIVLSEEGLDQDIIAHEMMHAELYQQIGFFKWSFKIPRWFDEGVAMQCDYRDYYSEDSFKLKSDNFRNMVNLKYLESSQDFNRGSREQIMLNYMTAAHEIRQWYSKAKMEKFIQSMNEGKSFEEAYHQ